MPTERALSQFLLVTRTTGYVKRLSAEGLEGWSNGALE